MVRLPMLAMGILLIAQSLNAMPSARFVSHVSPAVVQKISKALVNNRPDLVLQHLRANGLGINAQLTHQRENVLHLVAKLDDDGLSTNILKHLLAADNKARLHELDRDGKTPLTYAQEKGHIQLAALLRTSAPAEGADAMERKELDKNSDNRLGFHAALDAEHYALAARLLKAAVGMNGLDDKGWTPLMLAIVADDWEMVRELIRDGADLFAGHTDNSLDVAKMMKSESQLVDIFVEEQGANGVVHTYGRTIPLIGMAWVEGYKEIERLLLEHGAKPVHTDDHLFFIFKNIKELTLSDRKVLSTTLKSAGEQLIERLADEDGVELPFGNYGTSLLQFAAEEGLTEIVRFLLAKVADINLQDRYGRTALHFAAAQGHMEIVELLLANGADLDLLDRGGFTALMRAVWQSNKGIIKLLLANGADINLQGLFGRTALMFSAQKKDKETVEFLLANGADPNIKDKEGRTALIYALQPYFDPTGTVKLLLAYTVLTSVSKTSVDGQQLGSLKGGIIVK